MTQPEESSETRRTIVVLPLRLLRWSLRPVRLVIPSRPQVPAIDQDEAVEQVQLDLLLDAFGKGRGAAVHHGEGTGETFVYRPGRILVREEDLGTLRSFFRERAESYGGTGVPRKVLDGLHHWVLPRRVDVPTVLADLEAAGHDDVARPEHIVYVTGQGAGKMCPADEPRPARRSGPVPAVSRDADAGTDVRVSVVDTGWWEPAETTGLSPWLHDVDGDAEFIDQEHIHPYAGHGTFVAGVIRCLAPAVGIEVEGLLTHGGAAYESDIVRELNEAVVETFEPHVISISAGTYSRQDRGLLAFDVFASTRRLMAKESADLLVVAAAGNDSSTRPFFPAAYDWAIGVGSLDADGTVSSFSNTGSWVDVYAHGRDLVNAYPAGTYECHEPPNVGKVRHFQGLAQWSGTSFATPVVSGAVAAHMSTHGVTAHEAIAALVEDGKALTDPSGNAITAVGPPFA